MGRRHRSSSFKAAETMVPRKKGQKYEISYRCPKYEKLFSERFDSYEAAKLRIAQIEYERSLGVFEPPKRAVLAPRKTHYVTEGELLAEYVQLYGLKHWGDSYLSSSQHFIAHYIKPNIGDVAVKDMTTHDLDVFYDNLLDQPAVVLKGHRKKNEKTHVGRCLDSCTDERLDADGNNAEIN